jgi:hypothetical protein
MRVHARRTLIAALSRGVVGFRFLTGSTVQLGEAFVCSDRLRAGFGRMPVGLLCCCLSHDALRLYGGPWLHRGEIALPFYDQVEPSGGNPLFLGFSVAYRCEIDYINCWKSRTFDVYVVEYGAGGRLHTINIRPYFTR